MNVSLENIDKVSALLTVKLEKEDYEARVEKALKDFRKKANMPGFRPGMVPMGLIKKQYGTAIKAEEVNKVLQEKVYEYLKDNKVNMLGEPFPMKRSNPPSTLQRTRLSNLYSTLPWLRSSTSCLTPTMKSTTIPST